VIFGVCLLVQVALLLQYRGSPFHELPVSDALSYHEWAKRIAEHGIVGEPVFHQSPLFPILLGKLYAVAGEGLRADAALLLQILLTSIAISLLVPLGRAYLGSTGAGLIAAVIALLHAPFAFHALKLLPLPLALATQALALLLLARAREQTSPLVSIGAGLALGVATVARAEMLLFVPLAFGWLLGSPAARGRGYRPALFLVLGTVLAISPVTLHNLLRGDPVLIASAAGENLYIGNQRGADGGHTPLHPQAGDLFSQRLLAERIAEEASGRDLRASSATLRSSGSPSSRRNSDGFCIPAIRPTCTRSPRSEGTACRCCTCCRCPTGRSWFSDSSAWDWPYVSDRGTWLPLRRLWGCTSRCCCCSSPAPDCDCRSSSS
jgi:hypothetical protein